MEYQTTQGSTSSEADDKSATDQTGDSQDQGSSVKTPLGDIISQLTSYKTDPSKLTSGTLSQVISDLQDIDEAIESISGSGSDLEDKSEMQPDMSEGLMGAMKK